MPTAEDLAAAVRARAAGTPYRIVDERPDGFELRFDRPDAAWWSVFSRRRLATLDTHLVRVLPDGARVELTDVVWHTRWALDADGRFVEPQKGWVRSVARGTIRSTYRTSVADADGRRTTAVYDTSVGRRLVTEAAQGLGMTVVASAGTRVGVVVGIVAAAFGVAVALGAVVMVLVLGSG